MRGATLFSGGGGVEARLNDLIDFRYAVEYDPAIAGVYRANHGDHVQVAKVEDVDYSLWGALDYLHASPVCKNASQAKTNGSESDGDLSSAAAAVRCLEATQPRVFTLENVWGYRNFAAFRLICQCLDRMGYMWHYEHVNAADFGVPQTRKRLILRAVRDALLPGWPAPVRWRGWYAAIEDLIPTLPPSQFAAWQLARLPEAITATALVNNGGFDGGPLERVTAERPSFAIVGSLHSKGTMPRAFIVEGQTGKNGDYMNVLDAAQPSYTVSASADHRPARAWLGGDQAASHGTGVQVADQCEPAFVITTRQNGGAQPRAWISTGRVVRMTPRALARFQSLPDDFMLPDKASLACTVIGNAVPSLLMREIVEPLL